MNDQTENVANSAQFEYWNAKAATNWTENQLALDRLLSVLTERLFELANIQPGEAIIDVGCGTGASSLAAADAAGPGGKVLGIDLSREMLRLAQARADAKGGMAHLSFEIADAQVHPFAPGAYDVLQSRFGVMFFEDPVAAFANLMGALRPGGRLCCVCWGPLADNPWFKVPRDAAVKVLGPPEPVPPRAPGPLAFAEVDYVSDILKQAGFADVDIGKEDTSLRPAATLAEATDYAVNLGPATRIITQFDASAEAIEAIANEVEKGLSPYYTDDEPKVPAVVNFLHARRPG